MVNFILKGPKMRHLNLMPWVEAGVKGHMVSVCLRRHLIPAAFELAERCFCSHLNESPSLLEDGFYLTHSAAFPLMRAPSYVSAVSPGLKEVTWEGGSV